MKAHPRERGQALVIIILAIVAIFGFGALAVDMGRIFAERRHAQSAADAAALAAAYDAANAELNASPSDIFASAKTKALETAAQNGYDSSQVKVTPPTHGEYEECECQYIQVVINSQVDPIFAQFVFRGAEKITTEAIARGRRNHNLNENMVIHTLSEEDDALSFDGVNDLTIKGGDVYSNGGGIKNGTSGNISISGKLMTGTIWDCNSSDCPVTAQTILTDQGPSNVPDVPPPACPAKDAASPVTINGLKYYVHPDGINGTTTLERGVHCVYGDIKLGGGDTLKGDGVLIVLIDGGMQANGSSTIDLKRLNAVKDKANHSYNGMLIYAPKSNTSTITLGGNTDNWFSGTIYAPQATCDIGGSSTSEACRASLVCYDVKFHGSTGVNIIYKAEENFQMQPLVELIE